MFTLSGYSKLLNHNDILLFYGKFPQATLSAIPKLCTQHGNYMHWLWLQICYQLNKAVDQKHGGVPNISW